MRRPEPSRRTLLPLGALLLACAVGCVETTKVKISHEPSAALSGTSRSPRTAALVITPELREHSCRIRLVGGSRIYPLGEHMVLYAREVAAALFAQVNEFASEADAAGKGDVILIPRMVKSSISGPVPMETLLRAEWTIKDRNGQETLWVANAEGTGSVKPKILGVGTAERKSWQQAYDQLMAGTAEVLNEALAPGIAREAP